ncbi:hypothetical protein L9F63_003651, partial [Diploptera punctata]
LSLSHKRKNPPCCQFSSSPLPLLTSAVSQSNSNLGFPQNPLPGSSVSVQPATIPRLSASSDPPTFHPSNTSLFVRVLPISIHHDLETLID